MQEVSPHVKFVDYKAINNLSESDMERMKRDPVAMYLHSLRTHSRLPQNLHEAMLIHSLDPMMDCHVKSYLEWVDACERREESSRMLRRREAMLDGLILGSMVFGMLGYVSLLVFLVLK